MSELSGYELIRRACLWCGDELAMGVEGNICSATCERAIRHAKPCTYCGAPADGEDHVVPQAHRRMLEAMGDDWREAHPRLPDTVPSCQECNSLAGANVFGTVTDKRSYIHRRLRAKYDRVLRMPQWDESELEELGRTLRQHVRSGQDLGSIVRARLRWPSS